MTMSRMSAIPAVHLIRPRLKVLRLFMKTPVNDKNSSFLNVNEDPHPEERVPVSNEALIQQIKATADKLVRDGANRGAVKLLSTALNELRQACTFSAAYKNRRQRQASSSPRLR